VSFLVLKQEIIKGLLDLNHDASLYRFFGIRENDPGFKIYQNGRNEATARTRNFH